MLNFKIITDRGKVYTERTNASCYGSFNNDGQSYYTFNEIRARDEIHHLELGKGDKVSFFNNHYEWIDTLKQAFPNIVNDDKTINLKEKSDKIMLCLFALKFRWLLRLTKRQWNSRFDKVCEAFPNSSPIFKILVTCLNNKFLNEGCDWNVFDEQMSIKRLQEIHDGDEIRYREMFFHKEQGYHFGILNRTLLSQNERQDNQPRNKVIFRILKEHGRKYLEENDYNYSFQSREYRQIRTVSYGNIPFDKCLSVIRELIVG